MDTTFTATIQDVTINAFGTSITQGAGATNGKNYTTQLIELLIQFGLRVIYNFGIGGQNSSQISKHFGSQNAPIYITLSGGVINGLNEVAVTNLSGVNDINNQFLSTPADTTTRYCSGYIMTSDASGVSIPLPGVIKRTATGSSYPYAESYTFKPLSAPYNYGIPAGSIFYPDHSSNCKGQIQLFELCQNDNAGTPLTTIINIKSCISLMSDPKHYLVCGMTGYGQNNPIGTGNANRAIIDAFEAAIAAEFGDNYVNQLTLPTNDEMAAINYIATSDDLTDIANGIMPRGMMADNIHRTNAGYRLFAYRWRNKLVEKGWV